MIRNKRGISVISLVVTIVVLVILTSITAFTGANIIENSRKKSAEDRLNVIYEAILSHEKELGYGDTVPEKEITEREYMIMGLDDYAGESFTKVYVSKTINPTDRSQRVYKLRTPKKKNGNLDEGYAIAPIVYSVESNNSSSKVEFDDINGVNRPQIFGGMVPVNMSIDMDEDIRSTVVDNIYTENWYDYSLTTPRWANAELDNRFYVWIPRYAYKIQSFYEKQNFADIPSSAIEIVFLRGNTNFMSNGEILPEDYIVPPAFNRDGEELAGFWMAKVPLNFTDELDSIGDAQAFASKAHAARENADENFKETFDNHLMTNTEWAAMAYLAFASGGTSTSTSSIPYASNPDIVNPYGVLETGISQIVAAGLDISDEGFDNYGYVFDDDVTTLYLSKDGEELTYGDAILDTSSGESDTSSWGGTTSIRPSSSKKYILRLGEESFFAYKSWSGDSLSGEYPVVRNVLTVK